MFNNFSLSARRFALLISCGLLLANTACQKEESLAPTPAADILSADVRLAHSSQATITAAQAWFRQVSQKSVGRVDWPHALAEGPWLVAPFIDKKNPFAAGRKQGYRYLVVHEAEKGIYAGQIVEIVLGGLANTPDQASRLALQAVQQRNAIPPSIPGFTGWILIYSPTYVHQVGLVYQNGILQPKSIQIETVPPLQTTTTKNQTALLTASGTVPTTNLKDGQSTCIRVTTCGTVNGYPAGCESTTYCVEGGDGGEGGWGGGSGGGGGGGDTGGDTGSNGGGTNQCRACPIGTTPPPPLPFDDKIDDSSLKPCLTAVLNDIKLLNSGKIAEIIKKLSGNSPGFNWNVTSGNTGAQNSAVTSRYDYSSNSVTTTFDNNAFSSASELSAARTIIHESVHAYLVTYFASNTEMAKQDYKTMFDAYFAAERPDLNAAQHNEMARNWIQEIGYNLQQYGQSKGYTLSNDFYINMAWGGLTESIAFKSLSNTIQNEIKNVIIIESTGKDIFGNTQSPKGKSAGCP